MLAGYGAGKESSLIKQGWGEQMEWLAGSLKADRQVFTPEQVEAPPGINQNENGFSTATHLLPGPVATLRSGDSGWGTHTPGLLAIKSLQQFHFLLMLSEDICSVFGQSFQSVVFMNVNTQTNTISHSSTYK